MVCSYDLRKKALEYLEKGNSQANTSMIFGVTVRTLYNWQKRKKAGLLQPSSHRKRNPYKIDPECLKDYIKEHPDAYLREIAESFGTSITAIFKACKRQKITVKKRRSFTKKGMKNGERNFKK